MSRAAKMHEDQIATAKGFPRAYQVNGSTRHSINFLLCALTGLFLFFAVMGLIQDRSRLSSVASFLIMDIVLGALVLVVGSANNKRVILRADALEVAGWFRSRKLYFTEIRGRQTTANPRSVYGYAHIFVPTDDRKRKLFVSSRLQTDQCFETGSKRFPKSRVRSGTLVCGCRSSENQLSIQLNASSSRKYVMVRPRGLIGMSSLGTWLLKKNTKLAV